MEREKKVLIYYEKLKYKHIFVKVLIRTHHLLFFLPINCFVRQTHLNAILQHNRGYHLTATGSHILGAGSCPTMRLLFPYQKKEKH